MVPTVLNSPVLLVPFPDRSIEISNSYNNNSKVINVEDNIKPCIKVKIAIFLEKNMNNMNFYFFKENC